MLKVEKLIPGGQALATAEDGKKIFLWNALPGETVTNFETTKNHTRYAEAVSTSIINPSPHRVKPKDPCFLATSPWQIMDYDYELEQKRALLIEIFREHGLGINPKPVFTDHHPYHYRNKMEYALYYDHADEKIHLAFHARGSHRKIPIEKSSLERPEIFAAAQETINHLNETHAEARQYQSLLLRSDQNGTISGGLLENHRPHPNFEPLTDTLLSRPYTYSPNGFFQINLPVYEAALRAIKPHITTDKVLDLYAGVGSIGLSVAPDRDLTLVEVNAAAYRELCKNITGTPPESKTSIVQSGNILAILAKSEESITYITPDATVILDPPRAGCHPALLEKLLATKPNTIIYLSCNPATQARDIKILTAAYEITSIQPFNFFPRTPHLENLAILTAL